MKTPELFTHLDVVKPENLCLEQIKSMLFLERLARRKELNIQPSLDGLVRRLVRLVS